MYTIKFHRAIEGDLKKLDHSILLLFEKILKKIKQNPEIGKDLGNKNGIDLTGYKKIYFFKKKYRVVYSIDDAEVNVYVVSVGKRENMKVYMEAFRRMLNH